jgi:hypothetical protein
VLLQARAIRYQRSEKTPATCAPYAAILNEDMQIVTAIAAHATLRLCPHHLNPPSR